MTDAAGQLDSLHSLIAALLASNRFYADRLRAAGINTPPDSIEAFCSATPPTQKQDLVADQAKHPPFGTNLTYPLEHYTRFCQTSGTTGRPMIWLDTNASWQSLLDQWKRVYQTAGCTQAERVFFAFSFGPFLGFWTAFEAATQLGYLCIPGGGMSSAARLNVMQHAGATTLCCTPTYAIRLAQVAAEENINTNTLNIRRIIVAGEPGGCIPATRKRILQGFPNATLLDHHGMTEVGPVTYEDPDHPLSLRVMTDAYLTEVLDPQTLKPVPPGTPGELVLTTLKRTASPLLRYRTGDLVKQSPDDPGLLLGGILGRIDDMTLIRGVNVYPSAVENIVRKHAEVNEYRATVTRTQSQSELTIEIETSHNDPLNLCNKIADDLRHALQLRVPVRHVPPGSLPTFEMKAKRWVYADA